MSSSLSATGIPIASSAQVQADQKFIDSVDKQRIRVRAELAAIHGCLKEVCMTDRISMRIQNWALKFSSDVNKEKELQNVVNKNVQELLSFLVDPISRGLLDEHSFLGSDGCTYSSKTINLHLTLRDPYKNRSPLDPNDECVFKVVPHKNVECVCKFLRKFNVVVVSEEQEKLYRSLLEQAKVEAIFNSAVAAKPIPSTSENQARLDRLKKLFAVQDARDNQKTEDVEKVKEIFSEKSKESASAYAGFNKQIEENEKENLGRLNQQREDFNQRRGELRERIDNVGRNIAQLAANQQQLQQQNASIQNGIQQAKVQQTNLSILIIETNEEIERQKREQKQFIKDLAAITTVGCCAFGSWWISGALKAAGTTASGAVLPTLGGGAQFKVVIPL